MAVVEIADSEVVVLVGVPLEMDQYASNSMCRQD